MTVICDRKPDTDPLAEVRYRGRDCHIPRDDGSHSAHVMQYLALFITLSKVAGAVPSSPAVLVK